MNQGSTDRTRTSSAPFRIAFVPGVTVDRWSVTWEGRVPDKPLEVMPIDEEDQLSVLHDGRADMCFVRLPVDPDRLSMIPLYHEIPVVVVPLDHPVAAYDELSVSDLAGEHLLQDPDEVPEWRDLATEVREGTRVDAPALTLKDAIAACAADAGVVIVPKSVARLYQRRDVTHRPVTGVADSQVGLAWLTSTTDARIETFIGIVRGRTERSSRAADTSVSAGKDATKPVRKKQTRPSAADR